MNETVLGIDIGTSSTKGALVRLDGTLVAQSERQHVLSLPRPGWAEHDAEKVWWHDFLAVCAELVPIAGNGLSGVCISGIGPCLLLCDSALQPLRPAILYGVDTRAGKEIEELNLTFGETAIVERGGSALSSQALGPKLLWLRRNEPDLWSQAAGWYMASSFVVARLTGAYVLDHHSASQCNPLYELDALTWAEDWANTIAPGLALPELVWPGDQVGEVTADAARETGLPEGMPVVAGTIDSWAEAFSAGARHPGDLVAMYGSTMFFVHVTEKSLRHPLLWMTQGVERGSRTLAAGMSTAGTLADWIRAVTGNAGWDEIVSEASMTPPGSGGLLLLPYFAGERTPIYDPEARGVIAGMTLAHGRGHLLRATYEGIAFGARQILALLEAAAGRPSRIVAVGGGTRSALWLQIVSDVSGYPQQIPETTLGAAYGDALFAAIGAGLVEPSTDWSRITRTIEPSPGCQALYDDLYQLYIKLYLDTRATSHELSDVALRHPHVAQPVNASLA